MTKKEKKAIKSRLRSNITTNTEYCDCDEPLISEKPDGELEEYYYSPFDYKQENPQHHSYYICKTCQKK